MFNAKKDIYSPLLYNERYKHQYIRDIFTLNTTEEKRR